MLSTFIVKEPINLDTIQIIHVFQAVFRKKC